MEWKTALASFIVIFLSEVGDKTQLTTMTLAAKGKVEGGSAAMVFIGAAAALVLSALLGVLFGEAVLKLVPLRMIRFGAGVMFVALGALFIVGRS